MFKKLKKLMSLTVLTAMILSLVGVMPVMAEEPTPNLSAGIYEAKYSYINSSKEESTKLGKYASCQSAAVEVKEDGTMTAYLIFDEGDNEANKPESGYISEISASTKAIDEIDETEKNATAHGVKDGENATDKVKTFAIPLSNLTWDADNNAWSFRITYKKTDGKWATGMKSKGTIPIYEAKIALTGKKLSVLPSKKTANPQVESTDLKAVILRTGNVSDEYIGTDLGKTKYTVTKINENNTVAVKINGKYNKLYWGNYTAAIQADKDECADVISLTNTDESITISFDYLGLGKDYAQTFSIYSTSMKKWVQYSISFIDCVSAHDFVNGVCSRCNKADMTSTDVVKTTETAVTLNVDKADSFTIPVETKANVTDKALSLTTKTGTVTFDKDAVASIFGELVKDVTFQMKDMTADATYKDKGYDFVLDLNFVDSDNKNVFAEGTAKGTAKITVPYAKTVAEGKLVKVYYINGDKKEEVEATYDAETKTITFTVAHFSTYAVEQVDKPAEKTEEKTEEKKDDKKEEKTEEKNSTAVANTGDASMMVMYILLMLLASLSIVYSVKANRA